MCKKKKIKDPMLCTIDGCKNKRSSKLYCQSHFRRFKLYGDPLALKNHPQSGLCSVSGCKNGAVKKGLCDKHYSRLQKHGDPEKCFFERDNPEELSIKDRIKKNVSINADTGCWEWQKYRNEAGYGRITYNGVKWSVHRLSYMVFVGPVEGNLILHRCDNPCCCNPKHLYAGNHSDNHKDVIRRDRRDKTRHTKNILDRKTAILAFKLLKTKSNKEISDILGVGVSSICNIRQKKSHQEVFDSLPRHVRNTIVFAKNIRPDGSGEQNGSSVLTTEEVLKIRRLYGKGWSILGIKKKFGVSTSTIMRITSFSSWKNLSSDAEQDAKDLGELRRKSLLKKKNKAIATEKKRKLDLCRDRLQSKMK